mmetsp:Transcript_55364/g.177584  ORF Transcript_55364/g.177584 Transcript_55364/m.177584 type:complete len:435 (+) Transcript_55364:40-1344(+)
MPKKVKRRGSSVSAIKGGDQDESAAREGEDSGGASGALGLRPGKNRKGTADALAKDVDRIVAQLDFSVDRSAAVDEAEVDRVKGEVPELLSVLRQLRHRLDGLQQAAQVSLERFGSPEAGGSEGVAGYVEMKVQVLLSYLIGLVYYLLLKTSGVSVSEHPVMLRLIWIRTLLEKLRPVDQRLQYQTSKLLQWLEARQASAPSPSEEASDPHALRPGELAATVEDEAGEEADAAPAAVDEAEDGLYRPPKIAQVEYTGDHVSLQERAEKDLERKRNRFERSEFVRTLREEFTDAPPEIHIEQRSARTERILRQMAEKQAYEEDRLMRMKGGKKELREQQRLLRQSRATAGGAVSLEDATVDFHQIAAGLGAGAGGGRGRKGRRGGSALQEYQDATERAQESRRVVESTLGGLPPGMGGRKRRGGGAKGGGKRRKH